LAVLCFLPLLRYSSNHQKKITSEQQQPQEQRLQLSDDERATPSNAPPIITKELSVLTDHDEYEKEMITITPTKFMFWRFALELAFFNFGTQGLINVGLVTIDSSARASFLTQLSVVITPVLSAIFGHRVHCRVWFACIMALVGLYILSISHVATGGDSDGDGSKSNASSRATGLSIGDFYCLGGACCWSYYIYRMSEWGDYFDELETQFWKNIFLASMYSTWMMVAAFVSPTNLWPGIADWISWLALFYSALFPCTIADILQQKAQAVVPAAESNVIMSLEPVFTAILGMILLREGLAWQEVVGGGIIILASVLAST
jgi:drug/metabolite transporter (DMT)-like permease